jgi:hypothetical protein
MSSLTLACAFCPSYRIRAWQPRIIRQFHVGVSVWCSPRRSENRGKTLWVCLSQRSTLRLRDGLSDILDNQALDTGKVSVPDALSTLDRVEVSSWPTSSGSLEVCVVVYEWGNTAEVFLTAEDAARFRDFLSSTLEATS